MLKNSIIIINILLLIGVTYIIFKPNKVTPITNKEIIRDSLIRDTLYHTKDSLTTKLITIEKSYSDKKATIIANDTSADWQFFTEYIDNYSRTIKDN